MLGGLGSCQTFMMELFGITIFAKNLVIDAEVAFKVVLIKRSSENIQYIYRKTSMPKSDFNKIAKQNITHRHGFSPVNLLYLFQSKFAVYFQNAFS